MAKAQIEEHMGSADWTADPASVGLSAEDLQRISPTIRKFIDEEKIAGAVTIVARRGRVVHFEAYGMRDREARAQIGTDTIFRIYSMTKPVVAVAAMMLYEEGSLRLHAPVADYIPELGGLKVAVNPDTESSNWLTRLETCPSSTCFVTLPGCPALADTWADTRVESSLWKRSI